MRRSRGEAFADLNKKAFLQIPANASPLRWYKDYIKSHGYEIINLPQGLAYTGGFSGFQVNPLNALMDYMVYLLLREVRPVLRLSLLTLHQISSKRP